MDAGNWDQGIGGRESEAGNWRQGTGRFPRPRFPISQYVPSQASRKLPGKVGRGVGKGNRTEETGQLSSELGEGNWAQGTGSRDLEAGKWKQGTGNRERQGLRLGRGTLAVTWALAAILTWRRVLVVAQGLGCGQSQRHFRNQKKTIKKRQQLPGIGCCP